MIHHCINASSRVFRLALAGVGLLVLTLELNGATNLLPTRTRPRFDVTNLTPGLHIASRTNAAAAPRPVPRTNAAAAAPATGGKTNAAAAGQPSGAPPSGTGIIEQLKGLRSKPAFYPAVLVIALGLGAVLLVRIFGSKTKKGRKTAAAVRPGKSGASSPRLKPAHSAVHACNVLEIGPEARQIWQFEARAGGYVLSREHTALDGEPLPAKLVGKDWRTLFQRKLNVAWLPSENVFLRVAQFPKGDFEETVSMVELQLEKLSPIPVTQIAWSLHVLPHVEDNLQTVIVIIVGRNVVEEFLGRLEGEGYLADRLELPLLDQLQTTPITRDGAWIYPEAAGGKKTALVAWWYGGVLQNLDLLTLPAPNAQRPAALKEQLMQMAWAGEMEGWLTSPPDWHLVADVALAEWEEPLRAGLEQPIDTINPVPARELAALTARRAAHAPARTNLMPEDFATRYQQQFVDRLWMRGLLAVGAVYLTGVAVYMTGLGYATFRTHGVEAQVVQLGPTYTNAIQLRDRYNVLNERRELKFAGLNCWNTTARLLPPDVTLEGLSFSDGRRLDLTGSAPADQVSQLYAFEGAMRKATTPDGQLLFDPAKGEGVQFRVQGPTASWTLKLELKRSEVQ